MSYDVSLYADLGNGEVPVTTLNANYTYNCASMLYEATNKTLSLRDLDGRLAVDVANILEDAIADMNTYPTKYEAMEPPNCWGSADGWKKFLQKIVDACLLAPQAKLRVS
jgi:hypothetical protein